MLCASVELLVVGIVTPSSDSGVVRSHKGGWDIAGSHEAIGAENIHDRSTKN
jgi:hypothetical protein